MLSDRLTVVPRDPIENAAMALAQYRAKLMLIRDPTPWLSVHEDVRESYRDEVRLVLRAAGVDICEEG